MRMVIGVVVMITAVIGWFVAALTPIILAFTYDDPWIIFLYIIWWIPMIMFTLILRFVIKITAAIVD